MLNRILKKLKFVKEMEIKISQLEAVNHTLMLQKSTAVIEKNNTLAELNKQEYKLKQVRHYEELISNNPEWQFVGVYADEAITGTQTAKRDDFSYRM